jgi:hypothetical protein
MGKMYKQHGSFGSHGFRSLNPESESTIRLLGGQRYEGVAVTASQLQALKNLYGVTKETDKLAEAFAVASTFRHASSDGLRCMALIAQFVEPGEDPALLLAQVLNEAGFDVYPWDDVDDEEPKEHSS